MKKLKIAFISVARNLIPPKLHIIDGIARTVFPLDMKKINSKSANLRLSCTAAEVIAEGMLIKTLQQKNPTILEYYRRCLNIFKG